MRISRALAALAGAALVGHAGVAAAGPTVRTADGALEGVAQGGLIAFLGVPFAQAPVGALRWREPQPVKAWASVRPATKISPACVQDAPAPFGPYTAEFLTLPEMSEDCLYLNVWTPATSGRRPVLVFIHGGAFQSGSTSVPIYDGADLARKGAVVVTINYRLGVFGFMAHPELSKESPLGSSGNYGLLDMVAALRWVHANIGRLGGDPGNVTISGQSAGAIAVNQLLASPLAKGLFHRAIAESGPTIGLKMTPLASAELGGVTVAARANPTTLTQLRAMPAKDVFSAFRTPRPAFFPLPVMDGKVVISDPEAPTNPIVSKVPLIVGFNRDEAQAPATTAEKFTANVKAEYGPLAERILAVYPHATDDEAARSAGELARDRQMAGLLNWADQRADAQGQRVYVYRFDRVYPGADPKQFGSFHTAEVPYVFGTLPPLATADDRRVVDQVQAHWLAFMRKGDPSVTGAAWPEVSRAPGLAMALGDAHGMAVPASNPARLGLLRELVAQRNAAGKP